MFKIDENRSIFGFVGALKSQKMKEILFSHLESIRITLGHLLVRCGIDRPPVRGSIIFFCQKMYVFVRVFFGNWHIYSVGEPL